MLSPLAGLACGLALALPGVAAAATHTVVIEGMKYVPARLSVQRGDKVVWRNRDVVPHTATAKGAFDSGSMATGRSWSRTMNRAGTHAYVCTFHPGMQATVVVR